MIDCKTFYPIPNWQDLEGRTLSVKMAGRKLACWLYDEYGHLSANCSEKVSEKVSGRIRNLLSPSIAKSKKEAPVVMPVVRTKVLVLVGEKISSLTSSGISPLLKIKVMETTKKSKRSWLTVRKSGRERPNLPNLYFIKFLWQTFTK